MIRISTFEPKYAEQVVALVLPIQQREFGVPIELADQPDLVDPARFFQHGRGNFWVALDGDRVVGSIGLLDIGLRQTALRKMFVQSDYRGPTHRVAQHLLGQLLDWCRRHDVREVYLGTTAKYLAAHRFYEKNGFREITRAALPAAFPVVVVDSKFYAYTFA
jgi:GNAT superfamily N-acetyltransferase